MTISTPPGKFGKLQPVADPRTIALRGPFPSGLINAPVQLGWTQQMIGWGMLGNDQWPDCVQAAMCHQDEVWYRNADPAHVPGYNEADALALYQAITGVDPHGAGPFTGTYYLDALRYWQRQGLGKGRRCFGFGSLDWHDKTQVHDAIFAFGGVQLGFAFPADMDFSKNYWVPTQEPGDPNQGHGVCGVDYNDDWLWCVSWGALYVMSWEFLLKYGDEAYFVVSPDWQANPTTPAGVDLTMAAVAFNQQLATVTQPAAGENLRPAP